ncbi:MAG TPA: RsmG family class I SAM-dependent methyltransferase [Polyangia bacterium]|nr:RsmG family class I SAM-dependent methyltransferase [Polyangia bacterium]
MGKEEDALVGKEVRVLLAREAAALGMVIPPSTADALLVYFGLLLRWGARINLTAARSGAALATDHLPDALALASRFAVRGGTETGSGRRCLDAGSGGGLPAIPLALLRPELSLVLVEATAKKAAFLRTAVRELGLETRVAVENRRLVPGTGEHPDRESDGAVGEFDAAISRAMLPPEEWLPLGRSLVRPGGVVFYLGARRLEEPLGGLRLLHQQRYRQDDHRSGRSDRWLAELERST